MDVKILKKVLGVGLLATAAITNSTAHAANASVTVDVNIPTVLVMYHYSSMTLDIDQAALAGYLVGGTATPCAGDFCDDQLDAGTIPVAPTGATTIVPVVVADNPTAATTTAFTLQDVVGVRAFGCATYDTTVADLSTDAGVTVTSTTVAGIQGSACSFTMTRGDLSFSLDFDLLDATSPTATAIFDVTITGV